MQDLDIDGMKARDMHTLSMDILPRQNWEN